jgi:hypothetical protein
MEKESSVLGPANAVSAARWPGAAVLVIVGIAMACITGCASDNADLNAKMSTAYHTGFSAYVAPGEMLSNK